MPRRYGPGRGAESVVLPRQHGLPWLACRANYLAGVSRARTAIWLRDRRGELPAQLSGKIDWAQAGRADGWIEVTHFTHQKPRRPGATIRAG